MIKKPNRLNPELDVASILKDARRELNLTMPSRRLFAKRVLTLGGLSMLTGCNITDQPSVNSMLERISRYNDGVQAWLFDPTRLAPTYSASMMTRPFPFNAFYSESEAPEVDGDAFELEISGLVADKHAWKLSELHQLPQVEQITRHICVEGWSAIGRWGGVPFAYFLKQIGADLSAKYIAFQCADDYYTSIDMPTALHPQTQLTLTYDGEILPTKYGFPMKLRMPTKLGYKNPKHIVSLEVTNTYPGGYWEDQGYNWFGGS
ncbi:molybdopterin-dependent oxidoreductase [Glaciimonas soli]|uniref:Molybdopterin-dependent oxidoreductase n=1 Tax=Glaciimonas soli TaxID=2590999 RepID=A0A843YRW2_9BURK|nr:molybdopterin-dependent oxidoreductase [Glaciimonas soli]MQR00263.1 molybdopterin-dependent oxidoreductase [Glaciimonas soli]